MSASRSTSPSSAKSRAAIAATGLLMEAAWNSVDGVTGVFAATSASPYPLAQSKAPFRYTATLSPGTP